MGSLNSVTILGNLGKDPDLKTIPSGKSVANFSLATREFVKDGQDRTEWHNIVVWDKQAENAAKYLKKGSAALVQGRLQTRSWETDTGEKRYSTEIVAQNIQFLSSKNDSEKSSGDIQF